MKLLCDEVLRRFPEVRELMSDGDEDMSYLVVGYVVKWLAKMARAKSMDDELIERVVDFDHWAMNYPPGKTAEDDVPTIMMVAFHEELLRYDSLLTLIPHLMSRRAFEANETYFTQFVGAERYRAALGQFPRGGKQRRKR